LSSWKMMPVFALRASRSIHRREILPRVCVSLLSVEPPPTSEILSDAHLHQFGFEAPTRVASSEPNLQHVCRGQGRIRAHLRVRFLHLRQRIPIRHRFRVPISLTTILLLIFLVLVLHQLSDDGVIDWCRVLGVVLEVWRRTMVVGCSILNAMLSEVSKSVQFT
jgi:hypothetical protein